MQLFRPLNHRQTRRVVQIAASAAMIGFVGFATDAHAQATPPAGAEAAPPPPTAAPGASQGLEEVTVTAEKRTENLERAAVSETAISGAELDNRGISDPASLVGLAPSVQFQPSFLLLTYIRGVGNYSSQPGVDQSIAYNVDGIYLDRPYAMPNIMFDLSQIEMLRGPQGTLQGRNSTGGSINLVTNQPTETFGDKVSMSYGNYSQIQADGMINIPLGDGYAVRFAAATMRHDPYMSDGYWNGDTNGARASFLAKPTDKLSIVLTTEYTDRRETGVSQSRCPPGSQDVACRGYVWDPFAGLPGNGTSEEIDQANYMNADNWTVYANVNYDFDFGILTWVPSYRYIDYYLVQTASPSFAYAPAVHDDLDSQELRFSSEPDSPITWVGGLYYGRQWSQEQNYFLTGAEPYITVSEPGFPTITHVYFKNDVDRYVYESKSAFGQATAPVPFLDGLRVVGGLRYTMDHKDYQGNTGAVLAGPTLFDVPVAATESLYRITYKAGLEYDLTPQILTYANVSTGFKAGGANGKPPGSSIPAVFGPEKNTAYQAGIKSRFWDNRGQINAEAFYYDYDGYQTSAFAEYKGVAIGYNVNSQTARMYGGEVEGTFLLTPDDRIAPSISLLSAKYIDFFIPATGINLSGKPMQNAPGFTFTTNYTHTFQLASGADIAAHVDAHYEGGQWVDYRLSPGSHQDGFWRADADLTYDSPDGKWSLTAYCHNLSNDGSINTANGGLGAYEIAIPYPPRTYGLRVTANF